MAVAAAGIAAAITTATPIRRSSPDRMAGDATTIAAAMDGVAMMASCGATDVAVAAIAGRTGIRRRRSKVAGVTGIAMTIAGVDATMAGRRHCSAGHRRLRSNRAVGVIASLNSTARLPVVDAVVVAGV